MIPLGGLAQVEIRGVVTDHVTGKPIADVVVQSWKTPKITYTNKEGAFSFSVVGEVTHLIFTKEGYEKGELVIGGREGQLHRMNLRPKKKIYRVPTQRITAYGSNQSIWSFAGAIARLDRKALTRNNELSLLPVLNTIPGVMMDERGQGGSRRISIRGSALRSPFGVRNVKAYWNDIPLTSPDGSTPLEMMEASHLQSVEVIKGPASSMYGAGTGGALLFNTQRTRLRTNEVSVWGTYGSGNMRRLGIEVLEGHAKHTLEARYIHQRNPGYREQEFANKDQLLIQTQLYTREQHKLSLFAYYFKGEWGLPGAIDSAAMVENPRQAVPFALEGKTRVERERTRIGASYFYNAGTKFHTAVSLYGNFTNKLNPYGTSAFFNGYKRESAQGFGGRVRSVYAANFWRIRYKITVGGELQLENNLLREHENVAGEAGDLYLDTETLSRQGIGFAQIELVIPNNFIFTGGVSRNGLRYEHEDFFTADSIDFSNIRKFSPVWSPRLSLVKQFERKISLHGSVSYGFSPPTVWDVLNTDGSLNGELEAEKGINYEAGGRFALLKERLYLDVSGYLLALNQTIVPDVLPTGQSVFLNRGRTDQYGAELSSRFQLVQNGAKGIRDWVFWGNYAYQHFRFREYIKDGEDFSGNALTGVPAHTLSAGTDLKMTWGGYMRLTYRYVGEMPINDGNTVWADAYSLLDAKLGYQRDLVSVGKYYLFGHIYGGVNNILSTSYTSFLQLNGFGGRYFNPAPLRNFYVGIQFDYIQKK